MRTATGSLKYQVVIPQEVREKLSIKQGEKMQVISYENRIELVPVRKMRSIPATWNPPAHAGGGMQDVASCTS